MARKSSGSKGLKGADGSQATKPETVVLKLRVGRETARLLRLEAFGRDVSLGLVVEEMVRASPRRFVLVDRSKGAQVAEGPAVAGAVGGDGTQRSQGASGLGVVSA